MDLLGKLSIKWPESNPECIDKSRLFYSASLQVIQSLSICPRLVGFVMNILAKLITKQVKVVPLITFRYMTLIFWKLCFSSTDKAGLETVDLIRSLSKEVSQRRVSTGSGFLQNFGSGFAYISGQVVPKTLSITNLAVSRYFKGKNPSRPVDVRHSKTPLLKLPSVCDHLSFLSLHYAGLETTESLARICQMLPGNSSHPSWYPELDSVPFYIGHFQA